MAREEKARVENDNENLKKELKKKEDLEDSLAQKKEEVEENKREVNLLRKRLIVSLQEELTKAIRRLEEVETEETDKLTQIYEELYWGEEKCNSREIENKKKKVREIEKELIKKIDNEFLEEKIFKICKEVAELNFQIKQSRYQETQRIDEDFQAQIQVPAKNY